MPIKFYFCETKIKGNKCYFFLKKNKNKIKTIIPTTPDRIKMSCSLFIYFLLTKRSNSRSVFNTGRHDRAIELRNSSIIDVFNTGLESVSLRVFFKKKKHTRNYIILSFFGIKRKMAPRYKSMILSCPKQTLLSCPFFSFRTGRSEGRLSSESRTAF